MLSSSCTNPAAAAASYFYESTTGVYYDPRSKLYCKGMVWYSHTPGQDPAFNPVSKQEGTDTRSSLAKGASEGVSVGDATAASAAAAGGGEGGTATNAGAPTKATVGGKRGGGGWKKSSSRLAFGFKGAKLAKAGAGGGGVGASGVLGGADSDSSGDESGGEVAAGTGRGAGGGGVGVRGALAKKRQLEDVSKWNAKKLEVRSTKWACGRDNAVFLLNCARTSFARRISFCTAQFNTDFARRIPSCTYSIGRP